MVGKVAHVQFVNNRIGVRGNLVGILVIFPTLGVSGIQIDDHANLTVDTGGARIGVNCLNSFTFDSDHIVVVNTVQVTTYSHCPNALVALYHFIKSLAGRIGLAIEVI